MHLNYSSISVVVTNDPPRFFYIMSFRDIQIESSLFWNAFFAVGLWLNLLRISRHSRRRKWRCCSVMNLMTSWCLCSSDSLIVVTLPQWRRRWGKTRSLMTSQIWVSVTDRRDQMGRQSTCYHGGLVDEALYLCCTKPRFLNIFLWVLPFLSIIPPSL